MALSLTDREPVAVRAALVALATAAVHVLVVVGLLDTDTENAIGALIDAAGLVLLVLLVRPAVVPAAKVITRVTTAGQVVAGEAAVAPTGELLPVGTHDGPPAVVGSVPVNPELIAPPEGTADPADLELD